MKTSGKTKILVVLGPTAVGKSALAVRLARRFRGEVVSADSRQIYRGLDIGTGKIMKKEMRGIPHWGLSVASPKHRYTAQEFALYAQRKMEEIGARGKLPILCGGSGFYLDAAIGDIVLPDAPPNTKLRAQLARKSPGELFYMLKRLDPKRARTIDPANPRRLIRALEIAKTYGRVPPRKQQKAPFRILKVGIVLPNETMKQKIQSRLRARLRAGLVEEAKRLHKSGLSWRRMEELGLEYRHLSEYLSGKVNKEEITERLYAAICQYAKRQKTWFRRDKEICWFAPSEYEKIAKRVREFLKA